MDYARALDEELVGLVAQRDERALERLYEKYGRVIYSLVLRMLHDPGRAEEVSQEVFLKLWRRPTSYVAGRGSFVTWLLSVAHHRAVDDLRARRHTTVPIDELDGTGSELAQPGDDLADVAWVRERRGAIRTALGALPEAQRAAIELAYYGGFTQNEIALRLEQPLGTIKTRMRLGMQKLRQSLVEVAAVDGHVAASDNGHDEKVGAVPGEAKRAEL